MEKEQLVSLVTKAQQGDNEALNNLFNEFYNDLYYFALKTVKDDETALDVTQESFVEIINTLGNLKEPAAFVTWAKQITYHQCTRYFKKKKDVLVDEDEDGNTVFDTLKEENAEFIPDEALDKADFKKTVMAILDELSEEQRSAVMMYYFDEMSVKQIAEIQGVSEGTVKSRLNYARKAIKNSVEEYEKKHNIKLHAIPFFPFFKWIFDGMFEGSIPTASAEIIAEGVGAATGTTVTVATTTATATTVATTTTAGAVGIGAKIAAMPIATKIIAGVVAAAIVIGGGTTAVLLSQKDNTPTSADSQTDYSYRTEYMTSWNYEQALDYYHGWLNDFNMPYFNSVDEVSVDVAVRFGFGDWAGTNGQGELETDSPVGEQRALLKALFGRDFDFTKLTGEYATYNAEKGIITVNKDTTNIYNADSWRSDTGKPIDNGDGTYSIIIRDYKNKVNTLPDDIKDGEYVVDEENGGYFLLTHSGRLTIEKKDGFWVLKSYIQIDPLGESNSSTNTTTSEDSSTNNSTSENTTSSTTSSMISSTESTVSQTTIKITEDSYYYSHTSPHTDTLQYSPYYGMLCKFRVPVTFYPNGGTIADVNGSELTVSTPVAYLGYSTTIPMVPQDVSSSADYQSFKDEIMQQIADGYTNIPTTATWNELFTNSTYFSEMGGMTVSGVKYIEYNPAMGAPGDYYDCTMNDDGTITLAQNSNYMMDGCGYTLSNIKVSEDKKTVTATITHSQGFTETVTLKIN